MCHGPLICKAEDCHASVVATGHAPTTQEEAVREWNLQNHLACANLATACSKVARARAIVDKYMPGATSFNSEGHTITQILGDGRGDWLELRRTALGCAGIDTTESYLSVVPEMSQKGIEMDEMVSHHHQVGRRLKEIPDGTLGLIFKMHFLRLIGTISQHAVVEDKCATDHSTTYEDTVSAVHARANRIKNSSSNSMSDELVMTAERMASIRVATKRLVCGVLFYIFLFVCFHRTTSSGNVQDFLARTSALHSLTCCRYWGCQTSPSFAICVSSKR